MSSAAAQAVDIDASRRALITVSVMLASIMSALDTTIANVALRDALVSRRARSGLKEDEITGATLAVQKGDRVPTPAIEIGGLRIRPTSITAGDLFIFQHWKLTTEPALLIGMDVLGRFDTLIIDYRRRELQVLMREGT